MLNISNNSILDKVDTTALDSMNQNGLPKAHKMVSLWLLALLITVLVIFFLPWTQNIQMQGKVTTYLPEQRPQEVNSVIAGKIDKWFVKEGDLVQKGDTIAFLTETKAEYFDPNLIERTNGQIVAKRNSMRSYQSKANSLSVQVKALKEELAFKKEKLRNQIKQAEFKLESQEAAADQARLESEIAAFQFRRSDTLFQKGIKSLSDLESRRLKMQGTEAKFVAENNKLQGSLNELAISKLKLQSIEAEYLNKISKAESERFTTLATY
ncbi:MAG: biotin/lipoyl-binding protein, partial [Maribacter sp.]|nr:biotin/lipoyl-binding protein [Maribacter sp.]